MANVKTLTRSFAGGVITPEMFGRLDLTKFQTGLAEAENFLIYPHGPAANRSGTEYVLETKDSTLKSVLIPFVFSTTQSMVLEFGNAYVRFHTNGGTLTEATLNIVGVTNANPAVVQVNAHGFTTGQTIQLQNVGNMPLLSGRWVKVIVTDANHFQITDLGGVAIDTTSYPAFTAGGTVARVYEVVTPYSEADVFDLHYTQSADVLTITHPSYQQAELRRLAATNWTLTGLSFSPTYAAPVGLVGTPSGAGVVSFTYVVTALGDGVEESVQSADLTFLGQALTVAGATNLIQWANNGSVRYNVYRKTNGLYGYIGQSADGTPGFTDNNITPDVSKTPPLLNDPYTSANNFPGEVSYFQGRRWFAATNNKPQNVNATRSGTESNMTFSIPSRDSDQLAFKIASRQANTIRHLVPLSDLLILTSGGEWHLSLPSNGVITPSTIDPRQDGSIGASNVRPVTTSTSVIYAQDRGGRVREMQFSWQQQNYKTDDISIMAPHYFDAYTIKQMAFSRAPQPIAWIVRSDGTMLGLTTVAEHQVSAWHSHTTDGTFESCCVVPEGSEDVLYVIVNRTINGRTVRAVERLRSRLFTNLAHAFFVDCGLTYDSTPATTITGAWHLEGKTVNILADGAVVTPQVVANGSITLPQAASVVSFGLPITAKLKTLPVVLEAQAMGQGMNKNVNASYLRVNESSSIFAGPTYNKLTEVRQRTTEDYGTPPNVITGEKRLTFKPSWNADGSVCVQQTNPLPITVLSMALEVATGG